MDALLIEDWLAGVDPLPAIDEASAALARELVRDAAAGAGLPTTLAESLCVAASELVHNQLRHARHGRFAARVIRRGGVPGVELVAADLGPGLADPRAALAGPGPSERSLGAGLASARRMVHELDVDVRAGQGTAIRARIFAEPPPARREVGVLGQPIPAEQVSGDHALVLREGDALTCAVIDGIGHGPLAWDAAQKAAATVRAHAAESLAAILGACDAALVGTRGAVMSLARLDEVTGALEHAGVGNVTARLEAYRSSRLFASASATIGGRGRRPRIPEERASLAQGAVLVLYTDGLGSRASVVDEPEVLREHPVVIAQHLLATYGRGTDDALVMVVR